MKLLRHACLAALLGLAVACSLYKDIDQENGWNGVHLGTPVAELPKLKHWRDEGPGHVSYVMPGDPTIWGRASIARVEYHAYDGVLFKIVISSGSSKKMLPEVTADYGTPSFETPWEWHGEAVEMKFKGSESDSSVYLTIWNRAAEAKRLAELRGRLAADKEVYSRKLDEKRARVAEQEAAEKAAELVAEPSP